MKKLFYLVLFYSFFNNKYAFASSTFYGDQGIINTPSAYVLNDRNIDISFGSLSDKVSYIYNKHNLLYTMGLGFLPRTELGISFNQIFTGVVDGDNPYLKNSSFDRSIFLKFQILEESEYIPAFAIGGRDIFSNAFINRDVRAEDRKNDVSSWQQIFYLAFGKKVYDFNMNIGYSYAPGVPFGFAASRTEGSFRISGFFANIETPKLYSLVSGMFEFDSNRINYGVNFGPFYGFSAKAVMIDLTNFNIKTSWSTRL
ncbi:MAG: YjbH domain-containing protein [Candidatus Sericytochromatia bacterium]